MGPGSAQQREERCSASGTRKEHAAPNSRGVFVLRKRSKLARHNAGTSVAIRAFISANRTTGAAAMPFSMVSYFLGVGTVVGALALGFGGGIVLTKTAMKDTPAPSRVERAARAELAAATPPQQITEAKAPLPQADPAPAVQPAQPVAQAQPAAPPQPVAVAAPEVKAAEPVRQIDT